MLDSASVRAKSIQHTQASYSDRDKWQTCRSLGLPNKFLLTIYNIHTWNNDTAKIAKRERERERERER